MADAAPVRRFRVLIVEDHADVAATITRYLGGFEFEPVHAADGSEALAAFEAEPPDIVVLDLGLPDTDGTHLLSRFAEKGGVPVVVVTGRGDEIDRVVGLELGAVDYVTKPFSMRELLARLRAHLRHMARQTSAEDGADARGGAWRLGPFVVDDARRRVQHGAAAIDLTAAEFDLLLLLLEREVVSRDEIAGVALRKPFQPGDRSVDQLVHRLRSRLSEADDGWGTIDGVRGVGYRLVRAGC